MGLLNVMATNYKCRTGYWSGWCAAGAAPYIIAAPIEKSRVQAAQARLRYHQDVAKIQLDDITEAPAGDG